MKRGKHFGINDTEENIDIKEDNIVKEEENIIEKKEETMNQILLDEFTKENEVIEFNDEGEEEEFFLVRFFKYVLLKIQEIYEKITFTPLRLTGEVDLLEQRDIAKKKRYKKKRNRVYRNRIVLALIIVGVIVIGHTFFKK